MEILEERLTLRSKSVSLAGIVERERERRERALSSSSYEGDTERGASS